jgi:hypothetical protein
MVAVFSLAIVHEMSAVVGEVAVTNRFVGGTREESIAMAVVFTDEMAPPVATIASITLMLPGVAGR